MFLPCWGLLWFACCQTINGNHFIGCFENVVEDSALSEFATRHIELTKDLCLRTCRRFTYNFVGLQASEYCFCDNKFDVRKKVGDALCNSKCAGNSSQKCGGSGAVSIWTLCSPGKYGLDCKIDCSQNCRSVDFLSLSHLCHYKTAECIFGCNPPHEGKKCSSAHGYCKTLNPDKDGAPRQWSEIIKLPKSFYPVQPVPPDNMKSGPYAEGLIFLKAFREQAQNDSYILGIEFYPIRPGRFFLCSWKRASESEPWVCNGGTSPLEVDLRGYTQESLSELGLYQLHLTHETIIDFQFYGENLGSFIGIHYDKNDCATRPEECSVVPFVKLRTFTSRENPSIVTDSNFHQEYLMNNNFELTTRRYADYYGYIVPSMSVLISCKFECSPNKYGLSSPITHCNKSCPAQCSQQWCDDETGQCILGCEEGYQGDQCDVTCPKAMWGPSCDNPCPNACAEDDCDKVTGECLHGCKIGHYGRKCLPCPSGTYGEDCLLSCPKCFGNTPCDIEMGTCEKCSFGLKPPLCENTCPVGKFGERCARKCGNCFGNQQCTSSGECPNGCKSDLFQPPTCNCLTGSFGNDCSQRCGQCAGGVSQCSDYDGTCLRGCRVGFKPPLCQELCEDGHFGENCNQTCGKCARGQPCDKSTGYCSGDCEENFVPPFCQPAKCPIGFYGSSCQSKCGHCKHGHCDPKSSYCLLGCLPGYTGLTCATNCSSGFYGENCLEACGRCKKQETCFTEDGRCPNGCEPGWFGPSCNLTCSVAKTDIYCQALWAYYNQPESHLLVGFVVIVSIVVTLVFFLGFWKSIISVFNREHNFGASDKAIAVLKAGAIILIIYFTIVLPYL